MKQLDIFGQEIDDEHLNRKMKSRLTIKDKFRMMHGYNKANRCKNCVYHECMSVNSKKYHKCSKIGITSSTATDIRLKDFACNLFKKREDSK